VTGSPVLSCGGVTHINDGPASIAQGDLTTAYNDAAGRTGGVTLPTIDDIGGQTLYPGLYTEPSSLGITGSVTLDGQGNTDSVFIFQIGSTLITASNSQVILINGARAANVFWQVGSTCALDTTTDFKGTIMAYGTIALNTGAMVQGRVLSKTDEVTMLTNNITMP